MDPAAWLDQLDREGTLLSAAARAGDLDAPVPGCDGWSLRDAVAHTAAVYSHKTACIRLGRRPGPDEWSQQPPAGVTVPRWYDDQLAELRAELRGREPDAPAFTWYPPDQTVGFWCRRMAQETAIHRVDAQRAAGLGVDRVDAALAADGVDEVLTLMLGFDFSEPQQLDDGSPALLGTGELLHVAVTGGPAWSVRLLERTAEVTGGASGEPDATVTGAAHDLLLWLWGRGPREPLRVTGDQAAADRLRAALALATL